jgi:CRISPR-associated protein Csb1
MAQLTLDKLHAAVAGDYAGIRRVTRLNPVGDPKIFPSTYEGGQYALERRKVVKIDEETKKETVDELNTVLLDSVPSQANRIELALLRAYRTAKLKFPLVEIDFETGEDDPILSDIGRLTTLELPHRITDALVRDSELDGVAFRISAKGQKLDSAKTANATPVFELCPTALIFGFWDSTGPRGGLGAKVQRALVSEIVGYDCVAGVRPASRIDPVVSEGVDLYAKAGGGWTDDPAAAVKDDKGAPEKFGKKGKVSEINLGNVTPSLTHEDPKSHKQVQNHGGVTIAYAEQTVVLSLAALRRLRFPVAGGAAQSQTVVDDAARTVLAALALAGICGLDRDGFDLRSRCLLDGKPGAFQFVGRGETDEFALDFDTACQLVAAAASRAIDLKLPWPLEPVVLQPSAGLRGIVRKSRQKSMAAAGE